MTEIFTGEKAGIMWRWTWGRTALRMEQPGWLDADMPKLLVELDAIEAKIQAGTPYRMGIDGPAGVAS